LKPDVCRRVVGRLPSSIARKDGMATTRIPLRRSSGLSCEIARTWTRAIHLTTGTFNLVVKDRTSIPPERRGFSPEGFIALSSLRSTGRARRPSPHKSVRPRNLLKLLSARVNCQPGVVTGFPRLMHMQLLALSF